jgi:hypothetical protein
MSYAREAQALALKFGGPEAAIDSLRTRDMLLNILQEAKIEHDICEDVADACELNSLTALALASGLMDKAVVAELCYLTKDEAEVSALISSAPLFAPWLEALVCLRLTVVVGDDSRVGWLAVFLPQHGHGGRISWEISTIFSSLCVALTCPSCCMLHDMRLSSAERPSCSS